MKAIDQPFSKIIDGAKQFVIPVFQRDYSWTESQCEQLWSDILQIADAPDGAKHFMGSLVYVSTIRTSSSFSQWLLIDGQQRLTTLTLLLTALRDHIKEAQWSGDDDGPTAKRIDAYFLKNLQEEGQKANKLVLRRHDQATLLALLENDDLPPSPSERIRDNYEFFREQLEGADPALVYRGIGRLIVVDVTLDANLDDPQLIFESLNSTGVDLSQSDLIRNFILMRLPEPDQTRLYNSYWEKIEKCFRGSEKTFDSFVRDYMALKAEATKQEKAANIYVAFRRLFPTLVSSLGGLESLLEEMLRFARYHAAFSLSRNDFPILAESLEHLRRLSDVPATLMMRLFDCHDRVQSLTVSDFLQAIKLLESYILRRAIGGAQSRNYWQTFSNLAYRIEESAPLLSLKVGLARQREKARFPSDDEFRKELLGRDIYGQRVCKHLLDRLENHESKEPSPTNTYSIEHILPQNPHLGKEWRDMLGTDWKTIQETHVHQLGNLTLTAYNSTYSDRPFADKKTIKGGFEDSSVRLNKFVREQSSWTEAEISERGLEMADRCLKVWPALSVSDEAITAARQKEKQKAAAKRDVANVPMSPAARQLFDKISPLIRALDAEIVELPEKQSVSYHGPEFFLEVLPRKRRLTLLLALDFADVADANEIAEDATEWKFFFHANYAGGVSVRLKELDDIPAAMLLIEQAWRCVQ